MNLYVASSLANSRAARTAADHLARRGAVIVSAWHERDGLTDATTATIRRRACEDAHAAIETADAVIVLPHAACRGTYYEAGLAIGLGKVLHAIGDASAWTPMLGRASWWTTIDACGDALGLARLPECRACDGCEYEPGADGLCDGHRSRFARTRERIENAIAAHARGQGRRVACYVHRDRDATATLDEPNGAPLAACLECVEMARENAEAAE